MKAKNKELYQSPATTVIKLQQQSQILADSKTRTFLLNYYLWQTIDEE